MSVVLSVPLPHGRHDSAARRQSKRSGREGGCDLFAGVVITAIVAVFLLAVPWLAVLLAHYTVWCWSLT